MTEVLVVRHAQAARQELPNAERPLSEEVMKDARELTTKLASLGINFIYSSPYKRAIETVEPLCKATGLEVQIRDDLRESTEDEDFPEVRNRMVSAIEEIVFRNPEQRVVVCTHGGTSWGLISSFDPDFGYEQYKEVGSPDINCFVYEGSRDRYDAEFRIEDL